MQILKCLQSPSIHPANPIEFVRCHRDGGCVGVNETWSLFLEFLDGLTSFGKNTCPATGEASLNL